MVGSDVEAWFRQLDAAFRQLRTPLEDRVGLTETCLKGDAFDEWHSMRSERPTWTFEEFHDLMIREYLPPGIQISRDTIFYTTRYDSTLPVAAVIAQFKREMRYCRHLCHDQASLIRIFSMRLAPEILLHLSTIVYPTLSEF